jgi:hypothetical protein
VISCNLLNFYKTTRRHIPNYSTVFVSVGTVDMCLGNLALRLLIWDSYEEKSEIEKR